MEGRTFVLLVPVADQRADPWTRVEKTSAVTPIKNAQNYRDEPGKTQTN